MRKKWIGLLGLFAAALAFVSFHGGRLAYMLLYFVAAVPAASLIYTVWVAFRFKFFQRISADVIVKGEPVDYYFSLRNEDKFYYAGIETEFLEDYSRVIGLGNSVRYSLRAGEGKEIGTKLCCNYRGVYEVGARRFLISDYLHLFSIPYRVPETLSVTVLPRVVPWKYEKEVLEEPEGKLRGRNTRTGEMDVQVRNYETGDGLRQIHWKASGKAGKLMTREREENLRQGLMVFLDLQPKEGTKEEQIKYEDEMMEQAVSIVFTCMNHRIPVTLLCDAGGRKVYRIYGRSQWKEFYEATGKMCFGAGHPLDQLQPEAGLMQNLQYAVFLTGNINGTLYDWIKRDFSEVKSTVVAVSGEDISLERTMFEGAGIRFFQTCAK